MVRRHTHGTTRVTHKHATRVRGLPRGSDRVVSPHTIEGTLALSAGALNANRAVLHAVFGLGLNICLAIEYEKTPAIAIAEPMAL